MQRDNLAIIDIFILWKNDRSIFEFFITGAKRKPVKQKNMSAPKLPIFANAYIG